MKNVLITGATVNTGLAIARRFAKEGYGVAVTSRDEAKAREAAEKIAKEFSVPAVGYGLSLTDVDEIFRVFADAEKALGSLDDEESMGPQGYVFLLWQKEG